MQQIAILLLIGLAAGAMSGILGIGGGVLIIPALVMLLGYTQQTAQGTSLVLLLPPIGIFAVINYYKGGFVDFKAAGIMIITFIIGSYLSSKFAVSINEGMMRKVFAVFLIFYAVKLLLQK